MRLVLLLTVLLACGDDDGSPSPDAGSFDAGGEPDAGASSASLRWRMIEPPATGPLGRWAYLAVPLGGERALMIGGATFDALGAGTVVGDAWIWDASSGDPALTEVDTTG